MLYTMVLLMAPMPVAESYRWLPYADGSGDYMLMRGNAHVGQWHAVKGVFWPRDPMTRSWGEACRPPIPPPVPNFGLIETDRPNRDRWSTPAGEIPAAEAMTLLRNDPPPALPDEAKRRRVLVIGTADQTAAVQAAWQSDNALSPWRESVTFQAIPPGDWRLEGCGFQTAGSPVIYYLDHDGTVMHRQDDFAGGAVALAEALRDADSSYDRLLDPDRRNPLSRIFARVKQIPAGVFVVVILGCVAAVLLLLRKGK